MSFGKINKKVVPVLDNRWRSLDNVAITIDTNLN